MSNPNDLERAHDHCSGHRAELVASTICGCFYCLATFPPSEITEWTDWPDGTPENRELELGETAICPRCGIDSVIGGASGFPMTAEFLSLMQSRWFDD
jgi:hypothetical protein